MKAIPEYGGEPERGGWGVSVDPEVDPKPRASPVAHWPASHGNVCSLEADACKVLRDPDAGPSVTE